MVSVYPLTTSSDRLALLTLDDLPRQVENVTEKTHRFEIHDVKCSENALLLFNNKYVFKILRPYKDSRYSLKEISQRQACLLEGLHWNSLFTHDIHYGLARFYECGWEQNKLSSITLGRFLNPDIERKPLVENAEYVLVMRKLSSIYRLDVLLKNGSSNAQQRYKTILMHYLANIHMNRDFPSVSSNENNYWGSIEQLKNKLENNLISVEKPDITDKAILEGVYYRSLRSTGELLRELLIPILKNDRYQRYFTQRVKKRQIKRCHGDLKARNIWIIPTVNHDAKHSEIWNGVRVLDAIDFNPDFCNIDILSDFAMLVSDIYARTNSRDLADSMIGDYLRLTKQDDRASRFVLNYYLVEKAFVGALVSILYDDQMVLGLRYLEVTWSYLTELKHLTSV